MTEKELLYVEDAVNHELNIIAYLNDVMNVLDDEDLVSFMDEEVKKHDVYLSKLLKKLENMSNE
jgi:hypothetical protein